MRALAATKESRDIMRLCMAFLRLCSGRRNGNASKPKAIERKENVKLVSSKSNNLAKGRLAQKPPRIETKGSARILGNLGMRATYLPYINAMGATENINIRKKAPNI